MRQVTGRAWSIAATAAALSTGCNAQATPPSAYAAGAGQQASLLPPAGARSEASASLVTSAAIGGAAAMISAADSSKSNAPAVVNPVVGSCPAPPPDAPADAAEALNATNELRLKTGAGCMQLQPTLNQSATNHCHYNALNQDPMCMPGGHSEVMSCAGFTGADVVTRVKAAGYPGPGYGVTEVLTQGGTPTQAVMGWINTLWHRIPMLDPWTTDMGWGAATGCAIIDFGPGTLPAAKSLITVYPYDGQTDVVTSFNGLESPQPPKPESGWPSSSFVSVYAQALAVDEHVLTKDGDPAPIEHIWIDKNSSEVSAGYRGYLAITAFMYTKKPFDPETRYHAKVTGSHTGGRFSVEWSFTTGAEAPRGF